MISSAYNYYLSTYRGQQVSKYDSHKKSELCKVYNNMLKVNKKSPLYKIMDVDNVQKYAIDLKEAARAVKNVASSLTNDDGSISGFLRKKAISDNEAIIEAEYIGDDKDDAGEKLKIKVNSLAKPQINESKFLNPSSQALKKGSYFFDLNIGEYTYEFSFGVKDSEDNEAIQDKLIRLFNRSTVGINAQKKKDESGHVAIELESVATGEGELDGEIFTINHNDKSDADVVEKLGLDNMKQKSSDAGFTVNGIEHRAAANTFTIKQKYKLTLNNISHTDEEVTVGLKQDIDSVIENVSELIDTYNKMVGLAKKNEGATDEDSSKLLRDIKGVAAHFKNQLEPAGFKVSDDGYIDIDEALLVQSANEGTLDESLEKLNAFKKVVVAKADDISINPMKYVNKKLISYPNPVKNFTSPYVSSIYSGMMFNGYI